MSDAQALPVLTGLSAEDRQALERVLREVARRAGAIEQAVRVVGRLADSGLLAAGEAVLEEFDEAFSASTRPELMTMVANLMMLLGAVGQIAYGPFFTAAMKVPAAVNAAYPQAVARREPLRLREVLALMRSPEVAGLLQLLMAVLRAMREPAAETGPRH
ncbi:MAG: hypothetical protein QN183_10565 [Armatimonadota bacterium]|nr:hypothetical protein [Armatimonadota bacterium]MDR7485488.1 hypothetical protein [Armatimonadota bacterium]MDR7533033.1 hypothetical protein [Armatimonadota bacterium]MDR7536795.1 hypothetical protein [Armatimonadota bacterium]